MAFGHRTRGRTGYQGDQYRCWLRLAERSYRVLQLALPEGVFRPLVLRQLRRHPGRLGRLATGLQALPSSRHSRPNAAKEFIGKPVGRRFRPCY